MTNVNENKSISFQEKALKDLRVDCEKCFGLCCVALYFSAMEGFPVDKDAGKPCLNLQSDFKCAVHNNLREKGLKGCTAYDCFGAGQKVAQVTYGGRDWRQAPESKDEMFEVFLVMRQLHEMLWYLGEALMLQATRPIQDKLLSIIGETEELTHLSAEKLVKLDVTAHRINVNELLATTSELVRAKAGGNQKNSKRRRVDFIGADLRKTNLRGADLRGALLIAANLRGVDLTGADLIAADMRDADLSGANLKSSIFLTQAQINTTKGDSSTRLPISLNRPAHWSK